MDLQTNTSKTTQINNLILRSWRERWSIPQWGINIQSVLPRGVSGDVYNLADRILTQALSSSSANTMLMEYLVHSLCSHLVSHGAVLNGIAQFEPSERSYAVASLVEFVESIINDVNCRYKPEEGELPGAVVTFVNWIVKIYEAILKSCDDETELDAEFTKMLKKTNIMVDKLLRNDYVLAMLLVGRQNDEDGFAAITEKFIAIKDHPATEKKIFITKTTIAEQLTQLSNIDIKYLKVKDTDEEVADLDFAYCIQPILAVDLLLSPGNDTAHYVNELLVIQRLKRMSQTRLYYELIRSALLSLSNVEYTNHDTIWGAFTFFKVPQIIKELHSLANAKGNSDSTVVAATDHIAEVVAALEMIIRDDLLLDALDAKCNCNIVEYLLQEWAKQQLVNEAQVKQFSSQREEISTNIKNMNSNNQSSPSIINFIIRAEVPLSGLLKTLSADYNKVQEALLGVLCQVLVGNSFELILSVATVEDHLKSFVSKLIQCNENSKQVEGEVGKQSQTRSTLFDVSFLMLTFIVQTYGSDVVLPEKGNSFFEEWVHKCMSERNKPKNPRNIIALCNEGIVEELLISFQKPDATPKSSPPTWQDICMNLPAVLNHVLNAWESEQLSSADVKGILDNIKKRMFSFSVCATSYLCAYLKSVSQSHHLKPLNMIQQFLAPPASEDMPGQENFQECLGLAFQIIRQMQNDAHPSGNPRTKHFSIGMHYIITNEPLMAPFKDAWSIVAENYFLPMHAAQMMETLLRAAGAGWLTKHLLEEIIKCRYLKEINVTMELVFGILHLNLEETTQALLLEVPEILMNREEIDINPPQMFALARLCIRCIVSCMETREQSDVQRKRARSTTEDDEGEEIASKIRKLTPETTETTSTDDFATLAEKSTPPSVPATESEADTSTNKTLGNDDVNLNENSNGADLLSTNSNQGNSNSSIPDKPAAATAPTTPVKPPKVLKEPLKSALAEFFNAMQVFVWAGCLSPKIYFLSYFIRMLVEYAGDNVHLVLEQMPDNLIQAILQVIPHEDVTPGLICRLYNLRAKEERSAAITDLSFWRSVDLESNLMQL